MDADSFNELALRILSHEATEDDRRALDAELAAHPESREAFAQIKITHDILRVTAPMTEAVQATGPELPAHRVGELRTAVRQHFGPAVNRGKESSFSGIFSQLRWLFAGSGVAILGVVVVLVVFSNRTVEVGLYGTDLVRGGDSDLTAQDIPSAKLVTFDQDTPFDQWQDQPLKWYEHAKIWIDNEHDQIHIVRREKQGQILMEVQPLAPTNQGQRDQIKQLVESLQK